MNIFIHEVEIFLLKWIGSGTFKTSKLVLITLILGLLLNVFLFPGGLKYLSLMIQNWPHSSHVNTVEIIELQHTDITKHLQNLDIPQEDHRFKMTYRLFLPIFSRIIGIEYFFWKIFLIQLILLPFFVLFLFQWLSQFIKNPISVFYLLISLSTTYYISSFWQDIFLYGDAIAFFLLLSCLRFNHPLILFFCAFLVSWIDERAFISLFGILSWWGMFQFPSEEWSWSKILNHQFIAICVAILSYVVIRIYLQALVFPQGTLSLSSLLNEFFSTFFENVKSLGFSLWRGFRGTLGFAFFFILIYLRKKDYLRVFCYATLFSLSILFAFGAYDLSRGLTYFFPFILFAIIDLKRAWGEKDLHILFFLLIFFTITCSNLSFLKLPGGYAIY